MLGWTSLSFLSSFASFTKSQVEFSFKLWNENSRDSFRFESTCPDEQAPWGSYPGVNTMNKSKLVKSNVRYLSMIKVTLNTMSVNSFSTSWIIWIVWNSNLNLQVWNFIQLVLLLTGMVLSVQLLITSTTVALSLSICIYIHPTFAPHALSLSLSLSYTSTHTHTHAHIIIRTLSFYYISLTYTLTHIVIHTHTHSFSQTHT